MGRNTRKVAMTYEQVIKKVVADQKCMILFSHIKENLEDRRDRGYAGTNLESGLTGVAAGFFTLLTIGTP